MRKVLIITAKTVLAVLSLAGVGLLATALYLIWHLEYQVGLPDVARIAAAGAVCRTDKHDPYTPVAEIPVLLRKAIVASEEPEFYERPSLNPYIESALAAVSNRKPRPSGITWGVTKCLVKLSANCCRGLDWHLGNAYLVNRVAKAFSRDRLLEIYLNESYLGRGTYGVAAAAETYFAKPLPDLDVEEIAFLVMRARRPYASRYFDVNSRDYIIDRMQTAGLISETQAAAAKSRPLPLNDKPGAQTQPVHQ